MPCVLLVYVFIDVVNMLHYTLMSFLLPGITNTMNSREICCPFLSFTVTEDTCKVHVFITKYIMLQ